MANKTAILSVKIVSDAKDFSSKMETSAGKLDKFQQKAKKLAVPATAVIAGLGAIAISTGKMASEAEQNFGAVDAVFKGHADEVKAMAKTSAETLGLSGSDYAKYSALLGSQLKNAGVPMDELAGQTDKLIGYGADFAAQFGGTVPEAVEALSSALKGEMDPIEKYGISLNQSAIDAELARLGMTGLTGAAEQQAKAQAITNLIQTQGADAMGAFGREAGTAAGQQAIATAKWQDAAAALGTALLPAMTALADIAAKVATWIMENQGLATALAIGIGVLAAAVLVLNVALLILSATPVVLAITAIVIAVAALVAGIIYLATQTTFFQDVWRNVTTFARDAWNSFTSFVSDAWNNTVSVVTGLANKVGSFFNDVINNIRNGWNAGFNAVRGFVLQVVVNIINTVQRIKATASVVMNAVRNFFSSAFNAARSIVTGVINGIISVINRIRSTVSSVVNGARSIFSSAFNAMRSAAVGAINTVVNTIENITGAVQRAISWVRDLFNMGGMPGWMSKLFGGGATGFDLIGNFGVPTMEGGIGATGGMSLGTVFSGRAAAPTVNNYHIEISGVVGNQDEVGRVIQKALNAHAKKTGRMDVGAR